MKCGIRVCGSAEYSSVCTVNWSKETAPFNISSPRKQSPFTIESKNQLECFSPVVPALLMKMFVVFVYIKSIIFSITSTGSKQRPTCKLVLLTETNERNMSLHGVLCPESSFMCEFNSLTQSMD